MTRYGDMNYHGIRYIRFTVRMILEYHLLGDQAEEIRYVEKGLILEASQIPD
jgi:hypothetical protein